MLYKTFEFNLVRLRQKRKHNQQLRRIFLTKKIANIKTKFVLYFIVSLAQKQSYKKYWSK